MDILHHYTAEELQKCPFHSRQNAKNSVDAEKDIGKEASRPESGTDPKR